MPTRQYIGARYVPKFATPTEWNNALSYEGLTIVTHLGNSFTSKKPVPAGIDIANTEYWVNTGNYNAQVEQYRQEVEHLNTTVSDITKVVDSNNNAIEKYHKFFEYNAIGDGNSHPLSERYTTISDAKNKYACAESLTDEIDWCAIQQYIIDSISKKENIDIYRADYVLNKGLEIDFTTTSVNVDMSTSTLNFTSDTGITLHGKKTAPYSEASNAQPFNIKNVKIIGNGAGSGFICTHYSYFEVNSVEVYGFHNGFYLNNVDHSIFTHCVAKWCNSGLIGETSTLVEYTGINNLTFDSCIFGNNRTFGAQFTNSANIQMIGCSVESNGTEGSSNTQFGIIITGTGMQGATSFNLNGCYFEGNKGNGSIIVSNLGINSDTTATLNVIGCTFNKTAGTAVLSDIRIEANTNNPIYTNVIGSAFKSYAGYKHRDGDVNIAVFNMDTSYVQTLGTAFLIASEKPSWVA